MSTTEDSRVDPRIVRTREAVVATAAELLATEGIGRLTIDAIAQQSGVARSTIYRNWPDRADLLLAAFESVSTVECPLTSLGCSGDHGDGRCSARPAVTVAELRAVVGDHARRMVAMKDSVLGAAMASIIAEAHHDPAIAEALHRFGAARRKPLVAAARSVVKSVGARPPAPDCAPPLEPAAAMERFVAPFFYRLLITGEPATRALVERQVERLIVDLGLESSPSGP